MKRLWAPLVLLFSLCLSSVATPSTASAVNWTPTDCLAGPLWKDMGLSPQIMRLQLYLQSAGFYQGPADGWFKADTEAALKSWEQSRGLPVDGRVSMSDVKAMGLICPPPAPPTTAPPSTTAPAPAPPKVGNSGSTPVSVEIVSLRMTRRIILNGNQSTVDSCRGASLIWSSTLYNKMWLTAHRTACGARGFGGVQNLRAGDVIKVKLADGTTRTFAVHHISTIDIRTANPKTVTGSFGLVLQTSKKGNISYVVMATETTKKP